MYVGIDVGGTNLKAGLVDEAGRLLATRKIPLGMIDALGYAPAQNLVLHINFGLLEEECCRASFLRGVFFAGGSVTDPLKRYHLELATSHLQVSRELEALLRDNGFPPKGLSRNGSYITYFKQSDQIEDFLTLVGAPVAAMAALLTSVLDNSAKIAGYITECRDWGIKLLPPDINRSCDSFTVEEDGIRFGLAAVKNIGRGFIQAVMREREDRPFSSLNDFCVRMNGGDMILNSFPFDTLRQKKRPPPQSIL